MLLILKIAWRNVWRNWRRSVLTILAVVFATFFIIAMKGIQKGTFDKNIKNSLDLFTGYLQIQKKGYLDNPSLNKSFSIDLEMLNFLQNDMNIRGFSPRITTFGLIGYKDKSVGTAIIGIDPTRELLYSNVATKIKKGNFVNDFDIYQINVGERMIKNLGASVGDTIVILSQAFDGTMGNLKCIIGGVYRFGSNEFDGMSIFMNIQAADELLAMENRISSLAIFLHDIKDVTDVKNNLNLMTQNSSEKGIEVLSWDEVLKDLKQTIDMKVISEVFYIGILLMIVGFGILNTVLMSITERFNEFGVMLALGTQHYIIVTAVFIETIIISIIGILFGFLSGYIVNNYISNNPIILPGNFSRMYEELGFLPEINSTVSSEIFTSTGIIVLSVALIVYIYPAFKLFKLTALKGIRYT